jgi:hypothetical protein
MQGVECWRLRLFVHGGQNLHYFTSLLVTLCISASTLYAAEPNSQLSSSEKRQVHRV